MLAVRAHGQMGRPHNQELQQRADAWADGDARGSAKGLYSLSQKPSAHVQQHVVRVDRVQPISTPVDPRDVRYKICLHCYFTLM